MGRLVDADALLQWFTDADCEEYSYGEIKVAIQEEPTVLHWIPVTERLPKVDESVLVTTEWNDISIAWRIGIDKWFIHEGSTNATTDDIIAWMPLPEPYKED